MLILYWNFLPSLFSSLKNVEQVSTLLKNISTRNHFQNFLILWLQFILLILVIVVFIYYLSFVKYTESGGNTIFSFLQLEYHIVL